MNEADIRIDALKAEVERVKLALQKGGLIVAGVKGLACAIAPAKKISAEVINFMASFCRGLVRVAVSSDIASRCSLYEMGHLQNEVSSRQDNISDKWLVSIEASSGVSTGISAFDRAKTISLLAEPTSNQASFTTPGHIFPIEASDGGVLIKENISSLAVDLMRIADLPLAAAVCELLDDDGELLSNDKAKLFAANHKLPFIDIKSVVGYRRLFDNLIEVISTDNISTPFGSFLIKGLRNNASGLEAVALIKGDISTNEPTLMRLHSQCITGDAFASLRCDCGNQLHSAMKLIEEEGRGLILYLFQEGRGIGLLNKIRAYKLQDDGLDTVEANLQLGFEDDERDYSFAAEILRTLGVTKLRILTNNPRKFNALSSYGIDVVERVPLEGGIGEVNLSYMLSKKEKLGHILNNI